MALYKTVMLISEADIKNNGYVDNNVSVKFINSTIQAVQDIDLQRILGSKLYDDIRINVLTGTTSDAYRELLDDYIYYVLVYNVLKELTYKLTYKLRNLGNVTTTDTNVNTLSYSELQSMKYFYDSKADFYEKQLVDFLCGNIGKYPKYTETQDTWGICPKKYNSTSNIYFEKKNYKNYDDK